MVPGSLGKTEKCPSFWLERMSYDLITGGGGDGEMTRQVRRDVSTRNKKSIEEMMSGKSFSKQGV